MLRSLIGLCVCIALSQPAMSQVAHAAAPDSTASKCHGLTCTWAAATPAHQHLAGYEFYLDPVSGDPSSLVVTRKGSELLRTTLGGTSANITITCALGCHVFAVTWSDGGANSNSHVRVFATFGGNFFETNTTDQAAQQFKSHHDCPARGNNMQAYRFEGTQTLLLILSVSSASECGADMGYTEGYFVHVSDGKVLRTIAGPDLSTYTKRHPAGQ